MLAGGDPQWSPSCLPLVTDMAAPGPEDDRLRLPISRHETIAAFNPLRAVL